eukprot:TRINITY_DN6256_c0_g1_i2.p1 TRINITY_DN6256_c0_g1~~TRINITY_DN6256_c0_g1_i2.p1  ORF type:complete len:928 (+),score=219.80 TRINITY_DN6256_c0_g1_i2:56-2839(+)
MERKKENYQPPTKLETKGTEKRASLGGNSQQKSSIKAHTPSPDSFKDERFDTWELKIQQVTTELSNFRLFSESLSAWVEDNPSQIHSIHVRTAPKSSLYDSSKSERKTTTMSEKRASYYVAKLSEISRTELEASFAEQAAYIDLLRSAILLLGRNQGQTPEKQREETIQVARLTAIVQELERDNQEKELKIRSLNDELQKTRQMCSHEVANGTAEVISLENEMKQLTEKLDITLQSRERLETEKIALIEFVEDQLMNQKRLEADLKKWTEEVKSLSSTKIRLDAASKENNRLQLQLQEANSRLSELGSSLALSREKLSDCEALLASKTREVQEYASLQDELVETLQAAKTDKEESMLEIQQLTDRCKELEDCSQRLDSELSQQRQQAQITNERLLSSQKETDARIQEIKIKDARISSCEAEIAKLQSKLDSAELTNTQSREQLQHLQLSNTNFADLKARCKALEAEKRQISEKLSSMEVSYSRAMEKETECRGKALELERTLSHLQYIIWGANDIPQAQVSASFGGDGLLLLYEEEKKKVQGLKRRLNEVESELESARKSLRIYDEETGLLKVELQVAKNTGENSKLELLIVSDELSRLKGAAEGMIEELQSQQEAVRTLTNDKEQLIESCQLEASRRQKMEADAASNQVLLGSLSAEVSRLQNEIIELQSSLEVEKTAHKIIKSRLDKIEEENRSLQETRFDLEGKLIARAADLQDASETISAKALEVQRLEAVISRFKEQYDQLLQAHADANARIRELTGSLAFDRDTIFQSSREVEVDLLDLKRQIKFLNTQNEELMLQMQDSEMCRARLEACEQQNRQLVNEVNLLRQECNQAKMMLQEKDVSIIQIKGDCDALVQRFRGDLQRAEEKIQHLEYKIHTSENDFRRSPNTQTKSIQVKQIHVPKLSKKEKKTPKVEPISSNSCR